MPDREKVIKGLETCIKYIDRACPIDCPYYEICTKYEERFVFQPVLRDAFELLKEQEANKTIRNVPIQSLIDHIETAVDVDPWAKEMLKEVLTEQEEKIKSLERTIVDICCGWQRKENPDE